MSFASDSALEMGRPSGEQASQECTDTDSRLHPSDDVPLDLSMPRYPNRGPKLSRAGNSCFGVTRGKGAMPSYDVDSSDQPIDYSKKYVESNSMNTIKSNYVPRNSLVMGKVKADRRERDKRYSSERECKVDPYGDYAETDLDQPTDYSLRYAEDDADDDGKRNTGYFTGNEQEDTIKTYCTEGTPYETPLNFSTATSMSDLRLEDAKEVAKKVGIQDMRKNTEGTIAKELTPAFDEEDEVEDAASTKIITNVGNESVIDSSTVSVDKPVNYHDEGTPGIISRVSSLSSLGCANVAKSDQVEKNRDENPPQTTPALPVSPIPSVEGIKDETEDGDSVMPETCVSLGVEPETVAREGGEDEEGKDDERGVDKEGKVVTFGGEDHYAEETPLMFSRSSSLGSLSGFEQQSIHDDRSSIVSDFSRRTSGVVSPSELPDSPTQTVPPSPRHNQRIQPSDLPNRVPGSRNFSYVKTPRSKPSVFEDNIAAFKEESTPIQFSAATSLSSLTIDDEPKLAIDTNDQKCYPEKARTLGRSMNADVSPKVSNGNDNDNPNGNVESRDPDNYRGQEQVSDGDEDDEDILAACINMGMRNTTYRQSFNEISEFDENVVVERVAAGSGGTNLVRYQTSSTLDRLDAFPPILKNKIAIDTVTVPSDTLRVYCTEDTPADISPVGSQSNLSALSMLSISGDFEKDDKNGTSGDEAERWLLSGEDDNILDECIQSGIPKARRAEDSITPTAVRPAYNSSSHASAATKCEVDSSATVKSPEAGSTSPPIAIKTDEISINRESFRNWRPPPESIPIEKDEEEESPSSPARAPPVTVINDENLYDDSPNNSDDDAILTECILSAMPKARMNPPGFVNCQPPRKTPEPPTRRSSIDEGSSSFPSSHPTSQVFHNSVTRTIIGQTHETEELFTDTSSLSEDEEDLILAQCIRSGMPKASFVLPRILSMKKDDRGNNE